MPITWRGSRPWLAAFAAVLILSLSIFSPLRATAQVSDDDLAKVRAVEAARIAAIEKVYHTVVAIYPHNKQGGGSGVIFDPAGYALTNFHVTQGAGLTGVAGLADGKLYPWHLVGHDPGGDLAIIKLDGPTPDHQFQYAQLADSETVRVGDFAMAMGNPFLLAVEDQTPTITLGIVSGVKRYQPGTGAGGKMLEYGNCIQIDSSINPGNSGGPLFNMQGQVIGINGRGSFEERGRVNVGVGYAISANQCKMFIPELLATKTCEHGTLDAVFARRGDNEVVCESINLDSPLAKAGFELGDQLVKFNGQVIRTTNEFTSLIATLPAHLPVEVVWNHDGKEKSAWVRLSAITYPKPKAPPARPQPAPKQPEKKDEKKEEKAQPQGADDATPRAAEEKSEDKPVDDAKGKSKEDGKEEKSPEAPDAPKPDAPKPDAPKPDAPKAQPKPLIALPQGNAMEFGKIRDAKMNEREALRIIEQYVAYMGGREALSKVKGIRSKWVVSKADGEVVDEITSISATDGRDATRSLKKDTSSVWDGQTQWRRVDGKVTQAKGNDALADPGLAMDLFIASLVSENTKDQYKRIVLQGTDKAQGQFAYRILFENKAGKRFIAWFSVLDEAGFAGDFETRLLKTAFADDKDQQQGPGLVRTHRTMDGLKIVDGGAFVDGLDEKVMLKYTAAELELLHELPADAFVIPQEEK